MTIRSQRLREAVRAAGPEEWAVFFTELTDQKRQQADACATDRELAQNQAQVKAIQEVAAVFNQAFY